MTDVQILTVVLSTTGTFGLVLIGLIYNNQRLNDLGNRVNGRITDLRDLLRAEARENREVIRGDIRLIMDKLGDLGIRLTRLEEREH